MDYKKIYDNLVISRKNRLFEGKYEKHHILPKSMGGLDNVDNIVYFTLREHYLAHWLLWRIYRNRQMAYAFMMMSNRYKCSSRAFSEAAEAYRINGHSDQTKLKMSISAKGKIQSKESKRRNSEKHKGKKLSDEAKEKCRISQLGNTHGLGYKHTDEAKFKISIALSKRVINDNTRKKISKANKGKKLSEEQKRNISEFMKIRPVSEETKQKISALHKGKPKSEEQKNKIRISNLGQKRSEETKQKMRESRKKYFDSQRRSNS